MATVQARHVPLTQRGLPATLPQSVSTLQAAHAFVTSSQRAAVALVQDADVHVQEGAAPLTSQAGCDAAVHALVAPARQVTQRFIATSHTGVEVLAQAELFVAVHVRQVLVAISHAGVAPMHCVSPRQPQPPPGKQTRPSVHPQLASGMTASGATNASGKGPSRPASGVKASKMENASVLVSGRGPVSMGPVSSSAQRPSTSVLPEGHSDVGQPTRARVTRRMEVLRKRDSFG